MRDPNRRRRGANSAGSAERTRILVPAEQGNRVRVPDMERICRAPQSVNLGLDGCRQNSENSCISKALFPCKENLRAVKTGHWKGCHGPERRLKQCVCARKRTRSQRLQGFTRMNGSVRRPTNHRNERNLREKARVISAYPAHKSDG